MATYTVAAGSVASHDNQLTANSADTVTFADAALAVEVITDGSAKVYVTVDGSTPSIGGSKCFLIPAVLSSVVLAVPNESAPVVKLVSTGTPVYSVQIAS